MWVRKFWFLLWGIFLAVPLLPASAGAQGQFCPEQIKIRVSTDYLPFSKQNESGRFIGIDVDFARRVMDRLGCPYELLSMVWQRSLLQVKNGQVDAMIFASLTPERLEYAHFSAPYRNDVAGLVMRKADIGAYPMKSAEDLVRLNLKIGHFRGTYRGQAFALVEDRLQARGQIVRLSKMKQGLNMLEIGRIDALLALPRAAMLLATDLGLQDRFDVHPMILMNEPVHFMLSRKTISLDLLHRINRAIREVQGTSQYRDAFGRMAITGS